MENIKMIKILFVLLFFVSNSSFALNGITRPYQSARAAGMGNVRYTTGLYDENFFANPARATANPKWRIDLFNLLVETNSGTISNIDKLAGNGDAIEKVASTSGTNNHIRIQTAMPGIYIKSFMSERNYLAVALINSVQADLDLRRNISIEPDVIADIGPAITFGRKYKDEKLSLGVTAHLMYRVATRESFSTVDIIRLNGFKFQNAVGEGAHLDFDLGSTYKLPPLLRKIDLEAGFAINNIFGGRYRTFDLDLVSGSQSLPKAQPRTVNFGMSATKKRVVKIVHALTAAVEFTDIGNNPDGSLFKTLHIGGEASFFKDYIFFRAGLNQGYFCAGFGLDLPILKLDLATYGEEMGLNVGSLEDRRYVLKLSFAI